MKSKSFHWRGFRLDGGRFKEGSRSEPVNQKIWESGKVEELDFQISHQRIRSFVFIYCATNAESCCLTDWNPSSLEGEIRMANLAPCSTIEGDTESFEWAEMETVPSSPSDDMNWYLEEMPMDELVRFGNDFAENLLWNSFGIFTVARDI
ncbi:hypothetical protein V6N11_000842 [Hibiscus sabdariffa]|uniref:Uncharacterized protein n=1 Tax=Hibiscus sabdariffa TaxID=183260 RepID=A0ABR2RYI3_9ROSI